MATIQEKAEAHFDAIQGELLSLEADPATKTLMAPLHVLLGALYEDAVAEGLIAATANRSGGTKPVPGEGGGN